MRRKQYLPWLIMVVGIVGTAYGSYLLIYHFNKGNGLNVLALVLLIIGIVCLTFSILLAGSIYLSQKKKKNVVDAVVEPNEEEKPEVVEEPKEEPKPAPKPERKNEETTHAPKERRDYSYSSSSYISTCYVKLIGYGPLLRVEGNRILDMRNNTYYRIENNIVNQDGYGIRYEINGNQIRDAFGGYLFEISGSNIKKIFGGFYASISGNYITLFDSSKKYEMTDSLSKKQLLVVAALLFGNY